MPDEIRSLASPHTAQASQTQTMTQTIIFDLDGTMIDTAPDLIAAANHALEAFGVAQASADLIRPAISGGARQMLTIGLEAAGANDRAADLDAMLSHFLDHYRSNIATQSRPFPGLVSALDNIADKGWRIGVCTNKREANARLLLHKLGLDGYFSAILGSDSVPERKPHPDHLIRTIAQAGGQRTRALMIGDSAADIDAARAAGVPSIAVRFGYSATPADRLGADRVIGHFDELAGAIDALLD
jgi:phosphoglycolate phosphatase